MEIGDDVASVIVITTWEFVQVGGEEMLFIDDGEIKIIEAGSPRASWRSKTVSLWGVKRRNLELSLSRRTERAV